MRPSASIPPCPNPFNSPQPTKSPQSPPICSNQSTTHCQSHHHPTLRYNTIAAIIIVGVSSLVEFPTALFLLRTHLRDFVVWLAAFLCTLFLGAELGLGISIGLALLIVVLESAFPHTAVLGRVERTTVYRNVAQYPSSELTPGVLVVRLDAPVYFANCSWMQEKISQYEREAAA